MEKFDKFMNVWEIESNFKCPVIGAMLSVEKHRQILKKCGWDVRRMKPYEYHTAIMGSLGSENPVSVKVNNYIRHQAREVMNEVGNLYEKGEGGKVRDLWAEYARTGRIGIAMYAVAAHPDSDIELLQDIHGEVHMLAHANMTAVFELRKALDSARQALEREKQTLLDKKERIRELFRKQKAGDRENERLREENRALVKQAAALDAVATSQRPDAVSHRGDEEKILELETVLAAEKEAARVAEREKRQMEIEMFSLRNENQVIRDELDVLVSSFVSPEEPPCCHDCPEGAGHPCQGNCRDASCPNYRLCARHIFMIGGMTKMKSYYRDVVEQAGGKFDYHDGYMRKSDPGLAARIKRCDLVVCPVNCNSHNACLRVKKLCRRYNKSFKMLNSSSLTALTRALLVPEQA